MGKRRTAFLIAGVLAAAALTGCGGASGEKTGAKEKVRLMVWSSSEDQSKDSGQWLRIRRQAQMYLCMPTIH